MQHCAMEIMTEVVFLCVMVAQSSPACVCAQSDAIKPNLGHRHETATWRWFPKPLIFFSRTLRRVLKLSVSGFLNLNIRCRLQSRPLLKIQR